MSGMTREEAKNTICIFHEQILKDLWLTRDARNGLGEALDMAIEALKEQRPQGEWIDTGTIWTETDNGFEAWETSYKCSECGNLVREKKPFCDECGADMRKEGEAK